LDDHRLLLLDMLLLQLLRLDDRRPSLLNLLQNILLQLPLLLELLAGL